MLRHRLVFWREGARSLKSMSMLKLEGILKVAQPAQHNMDPRTDFEAID